MIALWFGVRAIKAENQQQAEQARTLRYQIRSQLWEIARFIGNPGDGAIPSLGPVERQAVEDLKALWIGSHVLKRTEQDALNLLIHGFIAGRVEHGDGVGWNVKGDIEQFLRVVFKKVCAELGGPAGPSLSHEFIMQYVMREIDTGRGIKGA